MSDRTEITFDLNLRITYEALERAVKILNLCLEDYPDIKPVVTQTIHPNKTGIKTYYQLRLEQYETNKKIN